METIRRLFALTVIAVLSFTRPDRLILTQAAAQPGQAARISSGLENTGGYFASISGDGRSIAFESTNGLMPGFIGDSRDVYVYDQDRAAIERVSVAANGAAVYNPGLMTAPPSLSASGAQVAFLSDAESLVAGDGNGLPDVFLHDRNTGVTELVSIALHGSSGNGPSFNPSISAGGRFVVFQSHANDLVAGDQNDAVDIFLRDRETGLTELVSVSSAGEQGSDPNEYGFSSVSVSGNGRWVAFSYDQLPGEDSPGSDVYLRDRLAQTTLPVAPGHFPTLSTDGSALAFVTSAALEQSDKNSADDVYVWSRLIGAFERVSVQSSGMEVNEQVILYAPDLTVHGRMAVFETDASLAAGDTNGLTDIYLHDRETGETRLISHAPDGASADGESHTPYISGNGSVIAFSSIASNLDPGDDNGRYDVYRYALSNAFLEVDPARLFFPLMANRFTLPAQGCC